MARGDAITAYPAADARPGGYPDELPFIAGASCWVARRLDGTLVIWTRGDTPFVGRDDVVGLLSRHEIERVIHDAGENREAMKESLQNMLIRLRAVRSPVESGVGKPSAVASATTEDLERLIPQLSHAGWTPLASGGASVSSRAFRRGNTLRFITADPQSGVVMLYESRTSEPQAPVS